MVKTGDGTTTQPFFAYVNMLENFMATLTLTGLGWAQWIPIRPVDALRLFAIACKLLSIVSLELL
jgi:hypothetical protein